MKTTDDNMIKKLRKIEDDKDREIISGRTNTVNGRANTTIW